MGCNKAFFALTCILLSMYTDTLLLYSVCEARLVWKNDIKISSSDFEENLERIPSKLLASLGLLVDMGKLERFDSIANSQPEIREEYRETPLKEYDYQIDYGEDYGKNPSRKRLAEGKQDYDTTEGAYFNGTVKELDYNLDEFKKDYDNRLPKAPEIAPILPVNNMSVIQSQDDRPFEVTPMEEYSQSCLQMPLWMYLFFGIMCSIHEIRHITTTGKVLNIIIFLLKTVLLIFPSLFLIMLMMWCYNGMCSCVFPLEFFHPHREIIKIKKAAYRIPPGVYEDEDGKSWTYDPTEEEKIVYEELLELIRS